MSNYNVDTLENKIIVEAREAIKSLENIIGYVDKTKTAVDSMKSATGLKNIDAQAKKSTSSLKKMQSATKGLKTALNFTGLIYGFKKIFSFLEDSLGDSVDYIETLNLFEVSMGKTLDHYGNLDSASSKYYTKALKFQNELNQAFGTNIQETMRYQALFNQMSESMGINDNSSYIISENLTKLGIDLASLFNATEKDTMEALRAGVLAGQTKPLRNYGLDVTQQTLSPIAQELGITKSVKQLSQAEKMILRYIAVLKQASSAHGDFAKTIESPANQLKVFKQQFAELKIAVGNFFQGLVGQILPYINAILMAIKEVIKAIAVMFGIKVTSANTNLSDQTGIEDLESGLDGAVGSAKELKLQLMGFDEINNITTDIGSGGSGGDTSISGVDSRLLDAMKEYDNLMSEVKMKATDIRDKIMEWLGFTKEINPLTGEINWELGEGLTNFEKILDVVKAIGISIGAWKVSRTITKFLDSLGIMSGNQAFTMAFGFTLGITGIYLAYKGTEHLLDGDVDAFTILETCLGVGAGTLGLVNMLNSTKYGQVFYLGEKIKMGLGVMLGIQGFQVLAEGLDTDNIKMQIGGLLESAFGGYLIGSQIGGWKLGLTVSLVLSVTNITAGILSEEFETLKEIGDAMWEEINRILESNKEIPHYIQNLKAQKEEIQRNTDASLTQIEYTRGLVTELESLVDINGKVYEGYETRAGFILKQLNDACGTEYSLVENQIMKNGELVESYNDIKNSINKIIEAKKSQILLEANEEAYSTALKNRMELYQQVKQATTDLQDTIVEMYEEGIDPNSELAQQAIKQLQDNLNLAKQAYQDNTRDIIYYEDLQASIIEGDTEKINNAISNMTSVYETEQGKVSASLSDRIKDAQMFAEETKELFDELGKDIDEQTQARLDASVRALAEGLAEQTKTIETLTPDQKEAWNLLATESYDIYEEQLKKLDPTLRTELQNMTGIIIEKTPEVERVTAELGEKMLDQLDNDSEMKKQAVESVKAYLQGLSEEKQRDLLKQAGIDNAEEVISGLKQGNLAEDVGINIIKGLRTGLQNNYWQGQTLSTAFSFASNVLSKFKKTFGIQSPSKKTKQFGLFLLEGLGLGIKNGEKNILNSVADFSKNVLEEFSLPLDFIRNGINIEQSKLSVDTNQFIDYGTIEGSINSKMDFTSNISQIPSLVYDAVMQGMKNSNIKVDIKAETEEGVIVKKASQGFKEYVIQTGELPFPIPI